VAAVVPVLAGVWQLVSGGGVTTLGVRGRLFGTFAHPNLFAFFLLTLIFLLIHFGAIDVQRFWKKRNRIMTATFVLLGVLLLMTFTRAAWIGLLVFLLIIGGLKYRRMIVYVLLAIIVFYVTVFPLNARLAQSANYRLERIPIVNRLITRNDDADSLDWRLSLLRETTPLIDARPLLGYGYGTFEEVWTKNRSLVHQYDDSAESHNDYLRLVVEIGFIGLLVYMLALLGLLYLAFRPIHASLVGRDEYIYLFAWVATFVVVSLSDNMLHHTPVMWIMWSWWGVLLAYYRGYESAPNFIS